MMRDFFAFLLYFLLKCFLLCVINRFNRAFTYLDAAQKSGNCEIRKRKRNYTRKAIHEVVCSPQMSRAEKIQQYPSTVGAITSTFVIYFGNNSDMYFTAPGGNTVKLSSLLQRSTP